MAIKIPIKNLLKVLLLYICLHGQIAISLTRSDEVQNFCNSVNWQGSELWNSVNSHYIIPDSKVHGNHIGPTWVMSAPDGPHVGPMNLAIRVYMFVKSLASAKGYPLKYTLGVDQIKGLFVQLRVLGATTQRILSSEFDKYSMHRNHEQCSHLDWYGRIFVACLLWPCFLEQGNYQLSALIL